MVRCCKANLREASNEDTYYCKGEGIEIYKPRFTFHGFRYIEISGVDEAPALEDVQAVLLSSVDQITGKFHCDNELINRFTQNVKFSQYCNFISIPTDCPQRNERMGWTGDAQVFAPTAAFNMDVQSFMNKWLLDVRDGQLMYNRQGAVPGYGTSWRR